MWYCQSANSICSVVESAIRRWRCRSDLSVQLDLWVALLCCRSSRRAAILCSYLRWRCFASLIIRICIAGAHSASLADSFILSFSVVGQRCCIPSTLEFTKRHHVCQHRCWLLPDMSQHLLVKVDKLQAKSFCELTGLRPRHEAWIAPSPMQLWIIFLPSSWVFWLLQCYCTFNALFQCHCHQLKCSQPQDGIPVCLCVLQCCKPW